LYELNILNRKKFLTVTGALAVVSIVLTNSVLAQHYAENGIHRLTDANGHFIQLPLPYNKNFLGPKMDEETVYLHHTFHHGGAVNAANTDVEMINKALPGNSLETIDYWTKKTPSHFSSHVLHTIFWMNLTNKKTDPSGELLKRIEKDSGSYDRLKTYLAKTSKDVDGNGWGIPGYQPYSDKLTILQCENHEKLTKWGVIPLLVIVVWEHAHYLKYRNKHDEFVDTLSEMINWDNVADRLNTALKIR
jgi:Fe-Mn family superoxide dismutase